jgi:hypothetical protein
LVSFLRLDALKVLGAVRFGICGWGAVDFAFGRVEPTHDAMKPRHEWGTRLRSLRRRFVFEDQMVGLL